MSALAEDLGLILDKTVKLEWHKVANTRTRCLRITQVLACPIQHVHSRESSQYLAMVLLMEFKQSCVQVTVTGRVIVESGISLQLAFVCQLILLTMSGCATVGWHVIDISVYTAQQDQPNLFCGLHCTLVS